MENLNDILEKFYIQPGKKRLDELYLIEERLRVKFPEVPRLEYMIDMAERLKNRDAKLVKKKWSVEKQNRWLGFIQSIAWQNGLYTIEELKDHNR